MIEKLGHLLTSYGISSHLCMLFHVCPHLTETQMIKALSRMHIVRVPVPHKNYVQNMLKYIARAGPPHCSNSESGRYVCIMCTNINIPPILCLCPIHVHFFPYLYGKGNKDRAGGDPITVLAPERARGT